jgi:hypothetical protein
MEEARARQLRNDLTEYAAHWWAGEAEVTRTFFSRPCSTDEHLRWLRLQAFKELQPRPGGIIERNIDKLRANYPGLERAVDRHGYLRDLEFVLEEFRHYVLFADVIDALTGTRLTPAELAIYELPEELKLRELRQRLAQAHGELARFVSSFCEGGGASLFYEGMQIGGDPMSDRIAAACRSVYEDEIEHAEHGAEGLSSTARTEDEWALARQMVEAISKQRLRMRNEQFGFPLSEQRLAEIDAGQIDVPTRFQALLT